MVCQTVVFFLALPLYAQVTPARLATADTVIVVEPGPAAPRLVSLTSAIGNQWHNRAAELLIDHIVELGSNKPVEWRLNPALTRIDSSFIRYVYDSQVPRLRLSWEWHARAQTGPIQHIITIQNLSTNEIWFPLQDSFHFNFEASSNQPLSQFWLEKGASSPSEDGPHEVPLTLDTNLTRTSSTYAHPRNGEAREIIPYLLIERANHSGWYTGIEFSGRTRISLARQASSLSGESGLNPAPGPYSTSLVPGETFAAPPIFVGAFKNGPDGAANQLRRWVRSVLNNPLTLNNSAYPMLVSNSWGSGMAINESQAQHMMQDASTLGFDMFHLDAGWFRALGDWVSNPEKFPHGVGAVADYAHYLGLKFGLWTDWSQAGEAIAVNPKMRDWLTVNPPPGWKPAEFKGITMDIGVPVVRAWAQAAVIKIVNEFHLDMLEHDGYLVAQGCIRSDHPHAPLDLATAQYSKDEDYLWVAGSNSTDVSYHATQAYYQIQSALRSQFPGLLLEICNDGGRMVDFGSAAHGDYFSITDAYDPLSNRRAFFDASYVLPPAMLETYVQKWPTPRIENFRYMLRSGMMGWFTLMQDSTTWTAAQHAEAKANFALYKTSLRPLIRGADLYHVSSRPDGVHWDGIEYFDLVSKRGVLFAFHGSLQEDRTHTFRLKGLNAASRYHLSFQDHSLADTTMSGRTLMQSGIQLQSGIANSSELVFMQEITR